MKKCILIPLMLSISIAATAQKKYTVNDVMRLSENYYGFVDASNKVDPVYGDLDYDSYNNSFELKTGCGACTADVFIFELRENSELSKFDIIADGKVVGYLKILDENNIIGKVKYCYRTDYCCCDPYKTPFKLKKRKVFIIDKSP